MIFSLMFSKVFCVWHFTLRATLSRLKWCTVRSIKAFCWAFKLVIFKLLCECRKAKHKKFRHNTHNYSIFPRMPPHQLKQTESNQNSAFLAFFTMTLINFKNMIQYDNSYISTWFHETSEFHHLEQTKLNFFNKVIFNGFLERMAQKTELKKANGKTHKRD